MKGYHARHGLLLLGWLSLAGCAPMLSLDNPQARYYAELNKSRALAEQFDACSRPHHGDLSLRAHRAALLGEDLVQGLDDLVSDLQSRTRTTVDLGVHLRILRRLHGLRSSLRLDQWGEDEQLAQGARAKRLLVVYTKAYFTAEGFVDRNGNSLAFPGISVEARLAGTSLRFHADTPNSPRIAADLTRLFLEAMFDADFQVPADPRATALQAGWEPSYPKIDPAQSSIPSEQFARITRDALRAEAAATYLVGATERGAGPFGVQNETAAAVVETAAGVIAKKVAEHEIYCYYRVKSDPGTR